MLFKRAELTLTEIELKTFVSCLIRQLNYFFNILAIYKNENLSNINNVKKVYILPKTKKPSKLPKRQIFANYGHTVKSIITLLINTSNILSLLCPNKQTPLFQAKERIALPFRLVVHGPQHERLHERKQHQSKFKHGPRTQRRGFYIQIQIKPFFNRLPNL